MFVSLAKHYVTDSTAEYWRHCMHVYTCNDVTNTYILNELYYFLIVYELVTIDIYAKKGIICAFVEK